MQKNNYLCTVKNASAGLKMPLNAKLGKNQVIKNKKWIRHSTTTELLKSTSKKR